MQVAMDKGCILLAENESKDVLLLKQAFHQSGITNRIEVVGDGQEAVEYLAGRTPFADRRTHPLPCLILLDLKLRTKDGLEVLRWVRQQPALRGVVVIIFTSSHQPGDVDRAYELGVNSFGVKPFDVERWTSAPQGSFRFGPGCWTNGIPGSESKP
jgi:CheY-like chemotaxis protein